MLLQLTKIEFFFCTTNMPLEPVIRSFGGFPGVCLLVEKNVEITNGYLTCIICGDKGSPRIPLNVIHLPYLYERLGDVRVSRLICSFCFWRNHLPDPVFARKGFNGLIPEETYAQIMFNTAFAKGANVAEQSPKVSSRSHRLEFAGRPCGIKGCPRVDPEVWQQFISCKGTLGVPGCYGRKILDNEIFPSVRVSYRIDSALVEEFYCTECFMDLIATGIGRASRS